MKRLKRRSRKHESFYTREYVEAMRRAFREVADDLSDKHHFNLVRIDSGKFRLSEILARYG